MLKQLLSRMETVHRAETREEREAVYRFRYRVYVEEFGRELGEPDHERKWVSDADDEAPYTTILYTGSAGNVTGTVRVRHWRAGEVPEHDLHELSIDRFCDFERLNTAEIGRLMVRKTMRGRVIVASLLRASYRILAGEHETDLTFCYCSPGLVSYYQGIAMRPFGGRLVNAPDGMMVPLVSVMSDHSYYKRMSSFLAPLVKRYFGSGKRARLDLAPYRHLFAHGATGIEFDGERVSGQVEDWLERQESSGLRSLLDSLAPESRHALLGRGLMLDVDVGTMITRKGFGERELYVILDGRCEVWADDRRLREMGEGELFGEIAFLQPEGRRTATVRAATRGRVLILRGRSIEKLMRRDPVLETRFKGWLNSLMAERLESEAMAA